MVSVSLKNTIYQTLPSQIRPLAKGLYHGISRSESPSREQFIKQYFESEAAYKEYVSEFQDGAASRLKDQALAEYSQLTIDAEMGAMEFEIGRDIYAIIREHRPKRVVETGVCNGLSTLCILLALYENEQGDLYSIDYPFYADESLAEFRAETFDGYGGAAIPADKEPGWIVPDELRDRWDLRVGKSQRELPKILVDIGEIDVFLHDSEHSQPCMMFEYEIAYEWLRPGGILLSDDITWSDAFRIFSKTRQGQSMKISESVGVLRKPTE